jgi:hypothetical protein
MLHTGPAPRESQGACGWSVDSTCKKYVYRTQHNQSMSMCYLHDIHSEIVMGAARSRLPLPPPHHVSPASSDVCPPHFHSRDNNTHDML